MFTRCFNSYETELLADGPLREASLLGGGEAYFTNYFRREHLPKVIVVLRFHGFEVEVEE